MYTDEETMDTCSVDEDSLTLLLIDPGTPKDLKAIIKLWWDLQAVKKQRSTFVASKLVRQAIGEDWYLRPGWNSCGTDTYRFSCSEPNVLNIEKLLRWMYKAKPGRILVGADWQQLEIRVMEVVANDRVLKKAIESGDVYSEDAKAWFGLDARLTADDIKRDYAKTRKACKIMHLGCQYWAGAATVHRQALKQDKNFEWQLTKTLHAKFPVTYADTARYWQEEMARAMEQGFSASRLLDRRRYYSANPTPNEAVNYPIQSTASDIADLALMEADRRLKAEVADAAIVVQQYDNIMVDCREKDRAKVESILRDSMEVEHTIEGRTRLFPVDISSGESWDVA
jgi:DNA polymerase-1